MSYNILAINPGHNGSACLLVDGKIEFYIEEERISRMKYDGNPFRGMLEAIGIQRIDELVIGGTGQAEVHSLPWTGETAYGALVRKFYPNVKITYRWQDHHRGHAESAFYNSGFETAAAIIVDGAGSKIKFNTGEGQRPIEAFETETIYHCTFPGKFEDVYKSVANNDTPKFSNEQIVIDSAVTITKAYEGVSHYLGFGFIEAGKTMGLAPYGSYDENIGKLFLNDRRDKNKFIPAYPAGSYIDQERNLYLKKADESNDWHKDPSKVTDVMKNLAWHVQSETQEKVGDLIQKAVDKTGEKNIVIAGGYGLNCVANYYYLERFPDLNIYIDPVSHDGGTSIGLAKHAWVTYCEEKEIVPDLMPLDTLYLGIDRFQEVVKANNIIYSNVGSEDTTYDDVAKLIAEGNIVSIFQSRSEAGPRALGNRSIVFDPRVKDGKDIVNKVKGREWFRPFAGSVLAEDAEEWFDLRGKKETPFMMYAVDVADSKLGDIPAITHVDGTCRVQTVTKLQNKHYYELIKAFKEETGVPILFNTSFNLAGEPLVETVEDALDTLFKSELKYLYLPEIGKLLIKKAE